jgi:hypothetical protein
MCAWERAYMMMYMNQFYIGGLILLGYGRNSGISGKITKTKRNI